LPDGETGIRKTWIRFLQQVLADNPAIEVATEVPPFKFTQWDGKLLREIPRLRIKLGATPVFDSLSTARSNQGYILKHSQERMLTVRKVMATRSAGMMLSSSVLIYRVKRPQSSLTTLNKQIHW